MTAFSEALRRERLRRGENQRHVAARFGVSQPSYYRWENGEATPRDKYRPAVAAYLGLDSPRLTKLLYETEEPATYTEMMERIAALERDVADLKEQLRTGRSAG